MELFPIWNVADMAIVLGVVGILYFQKTFHERLYEKQAAEMGEDPSDWERSGPPGTRDMHSADAHDTDEPASDTETESAPPEGRSENIAHRASSSSLAPSSPGDRSSMQGSSSDEAK